jgi:hypothetical protein
MRQCKCGGIIRTHELRGWREAWTCGACGRYEVIGRDPNRQANNESIDLTEVLLYARGNERECSQ